MQTASGKVLISSASCSKYSDEPRQTSSFDYLQFSSLSASGQQIWIGSQIAIRVRRVGSLGSRRAARTFCRAGGWALMRFAWSGPRQDRLRASTKFAETGKDLSILLFTHHLAYFGEKVLDYIFHRRCERRLTGARPARTLKSFNSAQAAPSIHSLRSGLLSSRRASMMFGRQSNVSTAYSNQLS